MSCKVDLIIDDKNYIAAMAEQLALDEARFSFAHAIDFLTMKGYLAANINTDQRYIDALKAAFNEVIMTPKYNAVMMLAQRP